MSEHKPVRPSGRRLIRRTDQAMIAGVAAGLADFLDIDPTLVRLAFAVLTLFGGTGVVLYIVMWVIVPTGEQVAAAPRNVVRTNVDDIVGTARKAAGNVRDAVKGDRDKTDRE